MRNLMLATVAVLGTTSALADTPAAAPKPAKGSPEEVVCRREQVTGSLAQMRKTCMTRAQWQAQSDANQAAARDGEDHSRINSQAGQ